MSTLLDSHSHHCRHRVLSQKAWETELYNEEPENCRQPVPVDEVANNSITNNDVGQLSNCSRRQQGQRRRRDNERMEKSSIHRTRQLRLRLVCKWLIADLSLFSLNIQITPYDCNNCRHCQEQSPVIRLAHNLPRSQQVDDVIRQSGSRAQREQGQRRRRARENVHEDDIRMIDDNQSHSVSAQCITKFLLLTIAVIQPSARQAYISKTSNLLT